MELTDYIFFNWWLTNLDWPDRNYLILSAGGRFHFISWDAEFGLRQSDGIQGNLGERIQTAPDGPANVFWSLCHSAAFRQGVRARLAALVAAEGGLNPESLATSYSRQIEGFAPFAAGEAARWGAIYQRPPATVAEWEKNTAWVTSEVIPKRSEILAAQVTRLMDAMDKNTETWAAQAAWRAAQGPSVRPVTLTPVVADPAKRDRDHDGLPDEWELAHGLNAKDPSDASADADHDGLTNLQEFLLGTDPGKADERANFVREDGGEVFSRITQRIKRSTLQRQARAAREIQLIEQETAKKAAEEAKAKPEEPTPAK